MQRYRCRRIAERLLLDAALHGLFPFHPKFINLTTDIEILRFIPRVSPSLIFKQVVAASDSVEIPLRAVITWQLAYLYKTPNKFRDWSLMKVFTVKCSRKVTIICILCSIRPTTLHLLQPSTLMNQFMLINTLMVFFFFPSMLP